MKYLFCLFFAVAASRLPAQQIQVILGPDEIAENQNWTITITVQNDRLRSYDNFPDIEGFKKRGTSTQSSTSVINGQISSSQSVIMNYSPVKQGTFTIPAFSMKVNDKTIQVAGKKVKVGPAVQQQQRDPFSNFFNRTPFDDPAARGEPEFIDLKEDAFLALATSKDEVYIGEGFNASLSFFVAEDNKAPLSFYELSRQLTDILKKIKPANCWEENFNIENIEGQRVTLNGKDYTQYKIYQATFFPLNTEPIRFPSVGLEMIKYKVARNPSLFGQNRREDFKMFYSKPKTVFVKNLPPHPLRDAVAVGDYFLEEKIRSTDLKTGQSASYEFNIIGEGNIAAIQKPTVRKNGVFEFYEPNIRQNIARSQNRVAGTKSFNYFIIPKEPGKYRLQDYFQWVFFNPKKQKYDTLRPKLTVYVTGESKKNQVIESNDAGDFYDKIEVADNTIRRVSDRRWQTWGFAAFLFLMVAGSIVLLVKK